MSRQMHKRRWTIIIIAFTAISVVVFAIISAWFFQLDTIIKTRLEGKRFLPPVEYYTAPLQVFTGQKLSKNSIKDSLRRLRYTERSSSVVLSYGEYATLTYNECQDNLSDDLPPETKECVLLVKHSESDTKDFVLIALSNDDTVTQVFQDQPLMAKTYIELDAVLFAQFYGADPIIRQVVQLGDTPPACLNATLAIEDSDFLHHSGISVTGLLRATVKNITSIRYAQGASTITQQLIKNYFLTPEKTLKRKVTEIAMAILLESRASKDDILETYINEIYMGQNGTFQIRGFAAASDFYFSKDLPDLNIAECAALAAIINNPGNYNPFTKPENTQKRRSLVLSRMLELGLLSAEEKAVAEIYPLPDKPQKVLSDPAPFFVDAVRRELEKLEIDTSEGLKIYTTLDLRSQEAAHAAIQAGLSNLEKNNKKIAKLKEEKKSLEAALVSANPMTGEITAIIGGRDFRRSQFNRVVQAKRQVGSIFKPIVYLTALQRGIQGEIPSPLTLIDDTKFTYKYEGQSWSPVNYDKKQYGLVPMYYALKSSLNIATAQLAIQVGLNEIVEVAHDVGIDSELQPVPALSLGVFEMTPLEVLQVYTTLARLGERTSLTMIRKIESLENDLLYTHHQEVGRVAKARETSILVGMMKQTVETGTAHFMHLLGFKHIAAGKTGTTSDTKDAWFAGFTPYHVAVAWVGYDDNTESGLTGASGAVPIWAEYMRRAATQYPNQDFTWPEDVELREVSVDDQLALNVPPLEDKKRRLIPITLPF